MRINLNVPYSDKDMAKSLGCRWDSDKKTWYVIAKGEIAQYRKWFKPEHLKPHNQTKTK